MTQYFSIKVFKNRMKIKKSENSEKRIEKNWKIEEKKQKTY